MNRRRSVARAVGLATAIPALAFGTAAGAWSAPDGGPQPVPDDLAAQYEAPTPLGVSSDLADATGQVEVAVTLAEPAIGDLLPEDALLSGNVPSPAQQKSQRSKVKGQQDAFVRGAKGTGARELARTQLVSNVVVMSVDAEELEALAALPNVVSVTGVGKFEKHAEDDVVSGSLAQAIDYLQVKPVHDAGIDGSGVRVAVLDSGIDYTHVNLGGPGDDEVTTKCFEQANQAPTDDCAELFGPDAPKVKGGWDFVGDAWGADEAPLRPDPNPIDSGPEGGHGTSVSDIIAGRSADGTHQGIAPGADLYGVKVCSSVSTSCSGVAILQGLDWALDPNNDGDISDAVDIVNMSLGASYGQVQNPSVPAVDNLVRAGVVVVASAGNSADRPFILGSPSSAAGAISVAQTALPDDKQWVVEPSVGAAITNAVHQSWSPLPSGLLTGNLVRPTDGIGCSQGAFESSMAGAVALIQRGTCNVSDKAVFAQKADAIAVIIYNNAPGDPPSFSFGSTEPVTVPTFTISQADGQRLATAMGSGAVTVTLDPENAIPLTNTVVGTSSRGTSMGTYLAKPDIGAPGAWLAAQTQTSTEVANFGGTSGAAPVVTGVAALILDKHEKATPLEVKARLLNGADAGNQTPAASGWYTSPVTRVGSGEVRAAPSVFAEGWLTTTERQKAKKGNQSFSFGGHVGLGIPSVTTTNERFEIELSITNTTKSNKKYDLAATFRDEADRALGAASWKLSPSSVQVPAGKTKKVTVDLRIDGSKLNPWAFDDAGTIGDGAALNGPELDGLITATSGSEVLKLGWTVLPRKAADVSVQGKPKVDKKGNATVELRNASKVEDGYAEVYSLTGTSPRLPNGGPGAPGSEENIIDLAAVGVHTDTDEDVVQFAIASHDRWTHPNYPIEYDVYIDSDNDGTSDFVLYQAENGGFAVSGQSVVYVYDLKTRDTSAYYYNNAGFDSSVMVFTVPASVLGLTEGQTFSFDVYAFENYFTGERTDAIEGMSFTVGQPKFVTDNEVTVPAKGRATLDVSTNVDAGPSTETGLLLRHYSAATNDFSVVTLAP